MLTTGLGGQGPAAHTRMITAPTATTPTPLLPALRRAAPWVLASAAVVLPLVSFFLSSAPLLQQVLVAAVLLLATVRAGEAWLASVVLLPIALPLGLWTGSDRSLGEPIVLAFLAGWLVHEGLNRAKPVSSGASVVSPAIVPAVLFGIAVLASWLVRLTVFRLWVDFPLAYLGSLFRFLWRDYFGAPSGFTAPVSQGAFALEGMGLFIASAVLTGRSRRLAERAVIALALTGAVAAGVTAALAAVQVVRHGWTALPGGLLALRTAIVAADVNAAGSYFLVPLGAAVGLALAASSHRRAWWVLLVGLSMGGLWLTGSRAALVAAPAAAFVLGLSMAAAHGRAALKVVVPVLATLAVVATAYLLLTVGVRTAVGPAMEWRTENAATALRMFVDHPVFGAGVGRFYELSNGYASPAWRAAVPLENAHNNFLQLLAELGALGLGLLLWLIGAVVRPACRRAVKDEQALLLGMIGGVVAFVITWTAGHPLLAREVALSFWLALGTIAGLATHPRSAGEQAAAPNAARARWAVALAGLLIGVSVVPRAYAEITRADLASAGMALSNWKSDEAGRRFRWMAGRAAVFVPANARHVAVPFRSPNGIATVKLLAGGRDVGRLIADGNSWREALLPVASGVQARFQAIEIRATVDGCHEPADCRVQVGVPRPLE